MRLKKMNIIDIYTYRERVCISDVNMKRSTDENKMMTFE